jgi:hypothetical protein
MHKWLNLSAKIGASNTYQKLCAFYKSPKNGWWNLMGFWFVTLKLVPIPLGFPIGVDPLGSKRRPSLEGADRNPQPTERKSTGLSGL